MAVKEKTHYVLCEIPERVYQKYDKGKVILNSARQLVDKNKKYVTNMKVVDMNPDLSSKTATNPDQITAQLSRRIDKLLSKTDHVEKIVKEAAKSAGNMTDELSGISGSVNFGNMVSGCNTALAIVGIAATIIGDVIIVRKINQMQGKVDEISRQNDQISNDVGDLKTSNENERISKYVEFYPKLLNSIEDLKNDNVSEEILRDTYNTLAEAAAYIVEMKNNFTASSMEKVEPLELIKLASYYMTAASLYLHAFKERHMTDGIALQPEIADYLEKPMNEVISEEMEDAIYRYFYSNSPGLPLEKDLYNLTFLLLFSFAENKQHFDNIKALALHADTEEHNIIIEVPEEVLTSDEYSELRQELALRAA